MEVYNRADLKNSFYDGMFAHMFATLTSGVFLTGFALYLGMNDLMIGLLAAVPFLVTAFQLPTSYFITKNGRRKRIVLIASSMARSIWIFVLMVAAAPFLSMPIKSFIILGLVFIAHAFISISYVSWLSWISELVPEKMRGRFFGTRNMLNGAAGMTVMVLLGKFLDYMSKGVRGGMILGFGAVFLWSDEDDTLCVPLSCGLLTAYNHIIVSQLLWFRRTLSAIP